MSPGLQRRAALLPGDTSGPSQGGVGGLGLSGCPSQADRGPWCRLGHPLTVGTGICEHKGKLVLSCPPRPTPEASPTHPGLVSGPGQGPRLLGPLPDMQTVGAGRGSRAGARGGPDPERPVFSDGPHAHPAIQTPRSLMMLGSPQPGAVLRGPGRAGVQNWACAGLATGCLPLPPLRLWALGGSCLQPLWLQRAWVSPRSMWRPAQAGRVPGSLPIAGAAAPPQGS